MPNKAISQHRQRQHHTASGWRTSTGSSRHASNVVITRVPRTRRSGLRWSTAVAPLCSSTAKDGDPRNTASLNDAATNAIPSATEKSFVSGMRIGARYSCAELRAGYRRAQPFRLTNWLTPNIRAISDFSGYRLFCRLPLLLVGTVGFCSVALAITCQKQSQRG